VSAGRAHRSSAPGEQEQQVAVGGELRRVARRASAVGVVCAQWQQICLGVTDQCASLVRQTSDAYRIVPGLLGTGSNAGA
jgi:hypothetical protein